MTCDIVACALAEDIGSCDITTELCVPADRQQLTAAPEGSQQRVFEPAKLAFARHEDRA